MNIARFKIELAKDTSEKVQSVIESGQLAGGSAVPEFENEIAALAQNKFAVATSNGFSALHLALEVLELKNKKILMPALSSCMAISNAIKASGNEPSFVDVELRSPNINAEAIGNWDDLGAIISPNYFGVLSNIKGLRQFSVPIIEDCAQSAGTQFYGNVSQLSDIKIFSFYPTKVINAIDGGMVTTNDAILKQKVIARRYYGGVRENDGIQRFNYKMSNVNAAFGLAQLHELQEICKRRRDIANRYVKAIGKTQFLHGNPNFDVYQKFILKFESQERRDDVMNELIEEGIPACTELNPMTPKGDLADYPNAFDWWQTHCSIPIYEGLTNNEVEYICKTLEKVIN